mgnify:CR=1 FL=1
MYNSEKDFLIIVYNYNVAAVKEFVILLRKESWFDTKFPFQKLLVNFFVPFHKETFKDNWGYINLIGKLKLIYNFLFGHWFLLFLKFCCFIDIGLGLVIEYPIVYVIH